MKFSVVIPVFNVEKYLRSCVDSVLLQSFEDFEIILVDDGSLDKCPQICDEYATKDSRIYVIHQNNAGIACARNAGIAAAQGEYVICIDSDDYLIDSDVLGAIDAKTYNLPDVVMFGYKKYFESDGSWGVSVCPFINNGDTLPEALKEMLINGSYIATAWTKAVRLNVLKKNNIIFRPGMVSGEDVDWYLSLLCSAGRIVYIDKVCVAYRQRQNSISHSPQIQSLSDFIWILEEWPSKYMERHISKQLMEVFNSLMAYYWANVLVLYSSFPPQISKLYKERLKNLCYLNKYAITSRALTVKKFYKLFGFDLTILLLKVLGKIKKRQ